jgi:hypothetical protein
MLDSAPYGGLAVEEVPRVVTQAVRGITAEAVVAAPVAPPRVPCCDASEDQMPEECWRLLIALVPQQPSMLQLRATYAQAGVERLLKQTGKCSKCGTVATVNTDGSLRSHSQPKVEKCPGIGTAPESTTLVKGVAKGVCAFCGIVKPPTKKGTMPSHQPASVACAAEEVDGDGNSSTPFTMLPPTTLPPVESLVLRTVWARDQYAFGCWLWDNLADNGKGEWSFDYGIIRGEETRLATKIVGVTVWRAFLATRIERYSPA